MVALLLAAATPAAGAAADLRGSIRMLERLEQTCLEYRGPNAEKLCDALALEGVRVHETVRYDPALDSVLLAWALYPEGVGRTYYGVRAGLVEIAVRRPTPKEAELLPLDPDRYGWLMVAATNLSEVRLDLSALRASVRDESGSAGRRTGAVESLPADDPGLVRALGGKARLLVPPAVGQGKEVAFPVVFPAHDKWTEVRFVDAGNHIDVAVTDYAALPQHLGRWLRAEKRAAARRDRPADGGAGDTASPDAAGREEEYVLVGTIRNRITPGRYGIRVVDAERLKGRTELLVRNGGGRRQARLKPIGSGTIAELVATEGGYEPRKGDAVYVRRDAEEKGEERGEGVE